MRYIYDGNIGNACSLHKEIIFRKKKIPIYLPPKPLKMNFTCSEYSKFINTRGNDIYAKMCKSYLKIKSVISELKLVESCSPYIGIYYYEKQNIYMTDDGYNLNIYYGQESFDNNIPSHTIEFHGKTCDSDGLCLAYFNKINKKELHDIIY